MLWGDMGVRKSTKSNSRSKECIYNGTTLGGINSRLDTVVEKTGGADTDDSVETQGENRKKQGIRELRGSIKQPTRIYLEP